MALAFYAKTPPQWVSYFDDTHWESWGDNFWNGSEWQSSAGSQKEHITLHAIGTWSDGFRPSAIRCYFDTGTYLTYFYMEDTNSSVPWLAEINDSYTTGQEHSLTFVGYDINRLQLTALFGYPDPWYVTDIQFFGG